MHCGLKAFMALNVLLMLLVAFAVSLGASGDVYWWVKPGVYFVYRYNETSPLVFLIDDLWYETDSMLVNYSIVNVVGSKLILDFTTTLLNAKVCDEPACSTIITESSNKTLKTTLEVSLEDLSVYIDGNWATEWFFLALPKQLRGEFPKLVRTFTVNNIIHYDSRDPEQVRVVELFFDILREDLGEDLVNCMLNPECMGGGGRFIFTPPNPFIKIFTLDYHGSYALYYIQPPPANITLTIKNYTLSGDRISALATIHGRPRDFSERELVFLDLERNISVGTKRVYSFKLKTAPLKLYTVSIEVPKVFYPCVLYNPIKREVYSLLYEAFLCGVDFPVTAYYDYITGVLLRAETPPRMGVFRDYTEVLGIKRVGLSLRAGPSSLHRDRGELQLLDTNISFERPIIGGVEFGASALNIIMVVVAVSAGVAVLVKLITKRRSVK